MKKTTLIKILTTSLLTLFAQVANSSMSNAWTDQSSGWVSEKGWTSNEDGAISTILYRKTDANYPRNKSIVMFKIKEILIEGDYQTGIIVYDFFKEKYNNYDCSKNGDLIRGLDPLKIIVNGEEIDNYYTCSRGSTDNLANNTFVIVDPLEVKYIISGLMTNGYFIMEIDGHDYAVDGAGINKICGDTCSRITHWHAQELDSVGGKWLAASSGEHDIVFPLVDDSSSYKNFFSYINLNLKKKFSKNPTLEVTGLTEDCSIKKDKIYLFYNGTTIALSKSPQKQCEIVTYKANVEDTRKFVTYQEAINWYDFEFTLNGFPYKI